MQPQEQVNSGPKIKKLINGLEDLGPGGNYGRQGCTLIILLMIAIFFLGAGYFLSYGSALFAILWSVLLIGPCLSILRQAFPKIFYSALHGTIISIIVGLIFGDFLLDNFYPFNIDGFTTNIWHRIFSIVIVFYIYICLAIVREFIKRYKTIKKDLMKASK